MALDGPDNVITPARLGTVSSYRSIAKEALPKEIFDYFDGAAGDEITDRLNRSAFDAITLRPFCLRDVSNTEAGCELNGYQMPAPIIVGPTAFHQLVAPDGEVATAKAAKACGLPMTVSMMSSLSMEEIAGKSGHDQLWLQCYIFKNRRLTETLIKRAERAGFKGLVLTVGMPIHGKRFRDIKNQFKLPAHCSTGNFETGANGKKIFEITAELLDPSLTWRDVEWLQSLTPLPIFIKGVLNPLDAARASEMNLAGIIVSNHGGRQLDTTEATISVLPDIVASVRPGMTVLLDSGVSKGADIFKALALGAHGVLLGRAVLWALTVDGEAGVKSLLQALSQDLESVMKLTGCSNVAEIKQFARELCSLPASK